MSPTRMPFEQAIKGEGLITKAEALACDHPNVQGYTGIDGPV